MTAVDSDLAAPVVTAVDSNLAVPVVLPSVSEIAELMNQTWESFVGETLQIRDLVTDGGSRKIEVNDRVLASIGITGLWSGYLTISLSRDAAINVAAAMFEQDPSEISAAEMADAVGELANVVGGNIKAALPEPSTLSLPQVIVDATTFSLFSARRQCSAVQDWRDYSVEASLWESVPRARPRAR